MRMSHLCDVVDTQGGPNMAANYVDASIVVNTTGGEFVKQPMFYAMAHFRLSAAYGNSMYVCAVHLSHPNRCACTSTRT
jgi:hypothetical protein